MVKFEPRTYTTDNAAGYYQNGMNQEFPSLIMKLQADLDYCRAVNKQFVTSIEDQRKMLIEQDDRIEELEQALKYLHDNIVDYYPSTYDFPSMVNAREVLKKEESE